MDNFIGLIRDTLQSKNPAGTWHWAKNILLTKGLKSIANEDGLKYQYLVNGTVIGFIATNYHVVYFHKNEEGIDEIGRVNTNNDIPVYETIIKTNLLNFQLNCPIEGIFVYNYKEELIVSWCDGVYDNSNPPRVLNLDNPPFALNLDGTLVNPSEFYNINLTPNRQQGNMEITYLDTGVLPGYVAYITIAYILNDDTNTGFFQSSDIAYLGIYANPVEPKGLRLNFTDLDTSYNQLRIGLVFKTEAVGETPSSFIGYQSQILSYQGDSLEIDITSLENYEETAADEIIIESTTFEKVNTITKVNNQAHVGNVVTSSKFNFQKFATRINIVPVEYIDEIEELIDDNPKGQDASLMPDEVYSLYIQLQKLDGSYTEAFHIPGRAPEGTETDDITPQQAIDFDLSWTSGEIGVKQFHIFNNGYAAPVVRPLSPNMNTTPIDESTNKMGCWLNEEVYPNDDEFNGTIDYNGNPIVGGEDLRGTPIRYHRMPGLDSMYDNTLNSAGAPDTTNEKPWGLANSDGVGVIIEPTGISTSEFYSRNRMRKLGLKITNIEDVIPPEILSQIQGYRLLHVKRNNGNNYVVGNWVLTRRHDYDDPADAGGDGLGDTDYAYEYYDFGFLNAGVDDPQFKWQKTRVIGNELFKFRPTLQPTYIKTNYRFQLDLFSNLDDRSADEFNIVFNGINTRTFLNVSNINRFSKCFSDLTYRPPNSIVEHTDFHEEGINLNLKEDYFGINLIDTFPGGTSFDTINNNPYMARVVLNTTAFIYRRNCYFGFKSDELNIIGRTGTIANNTVIKGGDVFNETRCNINARGVHRVYDYFDPTGGIVRRWHVSLPIRIKGLYSPANCTELYNDDPVDRSITDTNLLNDLDYDFDVLGQQGLSTIHDVNTIFTFDINSDFINRFPYRIYRGLKIPNEALSAQALSTYPISDYYEMPNDKGEIIALRGKERALFIQMRYSLFVAGIKDKLKTLDTDTYLGASDLFERPPEEVLGDDKGYIGSVSKFAAQIYKGMYVTVNQVTGQIFIIDRSVDEISNRGNKVWFWKNWDNGLSFYFNDINGEKRRIDNPFISVGHLTIFDKQYNRILFIKKMYEYKFPELIGETVDSNTTNFDGEFYSINGVLLNFDDTAHFINRSRVLSYSIETGREAWVCEHDYKPNLVFYTSNGLFSGLNKLTGVNRTSIYKHNDDITKGLFYGVKYDSYVDLIFNQSLDITKLLASITVITDVVNSNDGFEKFKTITHIMIYNNNQCSGIINLKDNHFDLIRGAEGEWRIDKFRDLVINPNNPILDEFGNLIQSNINNIKLWFEKSNFISKFITVRLIIDNVDNDAVYIHEVNTNSIISKR